MLNDKAYEEIIKGAFGNYTKARVIEYLEAAHKAHHKANPGFWGLLSGGFESYIDGQALSDIERSRILAGIENRQRFETENEKQAFIYEFLSGKVEATIDEKKLSNRSFTIKDLSLIENRLKKIHGYSEIKRKFSIHEERILKRWLHDLTLHGKFTIEDISRIDPESRKSALKYLVKFFFSIGKKIGYKEKKGETKNELLSTERCCYVTINSNRSITANPLFQIAFRSFYNASSFISEGNLLFKTFIREEKKRFKEILLNFSGLEPEYQTVSDYLYILDRVTEKMIQPQTNGFGISPAKTDELTDLIRDLTTAVDFIYISPDDKKKVKLREEAIKRCVKVLITEDYETESECIKFGCETTTIAYILSLINWNYSAGKRFNFYAIERSCLFRIPTVKKPSEYGEVYFDFKPLTRNNLAQSAKRYNDYLSMPDRVECVHSGRISSLVIKYSLFLK